MRRHWRQLIASSLALTVSAGAPLHPESATAVVDHSTANEVERVAIVIEFDIGGVRRTVIRCLEVPRGTSGADVLVDVATAAHTPAPTYGISGLMCSIDTLPAKGCGAPADGGYAYWSYWHGGTSWSYASVGPAAWVVHDHDVEGWRFESDSTGAGSDPRPDAPATYSGACADRAGVATAFAVTTPVRGASTDTIWLACGASILAVCLAVGGTRRWRQGAP